MHLGEEKVHHADVRFADSDIYAEMNVFKDVFMTRLVIAMEDELVEAFKQQEAGEVKTAEELLALREYMPVVVLMKKSESVIQYETELELKKEKIRTKKR